MARISLPTFLVEKGFKVLERNYRFKKSEIDLIVSRGNWLIFVEVKTRSSTIVWVS